MSMSALMCPHCGGRLLIDPTQRLQSMLTCPYCARKSLMQKKNGMIVLRGIISQANPPPQEPSTQESSTQEPVEPDEPNKPVEPVEPVEPSEPSEPSDAMASVEPAASFEPAVSLEPAASFEPAAPVEPTAELTSVELPELVAPVEPSMPDIPFEPNDSFMQTTPDLSAEPEPASDSEETTVDREAPAFPGHSDQQDQPAARSDVDERPAGTQAAPVVAPEMPIIEQKYRQDQLIGLASRAAASGQVMLFNSYARQAIDCDPMDPRAYALRARLIEEAHGFARSTFLSPVWMNQTPRQKAWTLAQHFASFNAAVVYSTDPARSALASEVGALIAWQIRESFLENARLRLGKRAFKGRFHRRDLSTAPRIIDACAHVNETVVPHVAGDLLRSVRLELEKIDPRLADQLQRIGF